MYSGQQCLATILYFHRVSLHVCSYYARTLEGDVRQDIVNEDIVLSRRLKGNDISYNGTGSSRLQLV
jgi:hypothetical protein